LNINSRTGTFYSVSRTTTPITCILIRDSGGVISVDYRSKDTNLSIIIQDDGPGIPPKQRARVFDPFYTTKKRGTGLGLTVTKKLIENLFGYIELRPSKRGAVFKITLPILSVSKSEA
jgi:signal transduction histidine kinase